MVKLLFYTLVLLSLLSLSCQKQQRRTQEEDDAAFSEFDADFDEETAKTTAQKAPTKTPPPPKQQQADFADFDDSIVEEEAEDDDEEFERVKKPPTPTKQQTSQQKPAQQQQQHDDIDSEEFEHLVDEEEFEDVAPKKKEPAKKKEQPPQQQQMPSLKITDVPQHLMSDGNWRNYIYELVMLAVIGVYLVNFLYGKSRNYRLVTAWYHAHRELLQRQFAVVGDDGTSPDLSARSLTNLNGELLGTLIKESESCYGLWCTGRQSCDGMLVTLKLVKRQCLVNGLLMQFFKPQSDQIVVCVEFAAHDDVDNFVFCLNQKKVTQQLAADYQDVATFCSEKKALPAALSENGSLAAQVTQRYVMLNEIGEAASYVLDQRVCAFLNRYPDMIEYLLVSDQFVGYKVQVNDETSAAPERPTTSTTAEGGENKSNGDAAPAAPSGTGLPKSRCVMVMCLNVAGKGLSTSAEDMEKMQPAFQLAMHLIDKVPRIRLSKEAKNKALKKRREVSELFMKATNKQRQEQAMLRKEEKRRAEKDRIMNETDPEKQKRLYEEEQKREKRKNASKFKQIKIKTM